MSKNGLENQTPRNAPVQLNYVHSLTHRSLCVYTLICWIDGLDRLALAEEVGAWSNGARVFVEPDNERG